MDERRVRQIRASLAPARQRAEIQRTDAGTMLWLPKHYPCWHARALVRAINQLRPEGVERQELPPHLCVTHTTPEPHFVSLNGLRPSDIHFLEDECLTLDHMRPELLPEAVAHYLSTRDCLRPRPPAPSPVARLPGPAPPDTEG